MIKILIVDDSATEAALIQHIIQSENDMEVIGVAKNGQEAIDLTEKLNPNLITMDIPGMDKDKINVQIKEGTLIISGERQSENQDNNNQYYRQERSFGSFMQAIPLPDDAKTDQIDARYKNGVLTVTVARMKKEEKKSEGEKIKVD